MTDMGSTTPTDESHASRRRHERVPTRGQVQACVKVPYDPETEGQEYDMEILEISPGGLRIRGPEPLVAEAIDLVASIDGFESAIFLCTSVRWHEEDDEGFQLFGVEIEDNDASDLETWCEFQREEWFREKAEAEAGS